MALLSLRRSKRPGLHDGSNSSCEHPERTESPLAYPSHYSHEVGRTMSNQSRCLCPKDARGSTWHARCENSAHRLYCCPGFRLSMLRCICASQGLRSLHLKLRNTTRDELTFEIQRGTFFHNLDRFYQPLLLLETLVGTLAGDEAPFVGGLRVLALTRLIGGDRHKYSYTSMGKRQRWSLL